MNEVKNFGFIADEITPDQWVLGANSKVEQPALTDGDWEDFLPTKEQQNRGFETNACTIYGTLGCLETLSKRVFNTDPNYSERFNAILAEVDPYRGGTPHNAIQAMRHYGLIGETELPFTDKLETVEEYYSGITPQMIHQGNQWLDDFKITHDWVFTPSTVWADRAKAITEALKYSPLGVSVPAWHKKDDYYHRPDGVEDNHWCMLFKEDEEFYYLFDSYAPFIKKFRKDSMFSFAKRYSISLNLSPRKGWLCRTFNIFC